MLKKQIKSFFRLYNSCAKSMSSEMAFCVTATQIPFVHVNRIGSGDTRACIQGLCNLYRYNKVVGRSTAPIESLFETLAKKKKVRVVLDSETLDYLEDPKRLFDDEDDGSWLHDEVLI